MLAVGAVVAGLPRVPRKIGVFATCAPSFHLRLAFETSHSNGHSRRKNGLRDASKDAVLVPTVNLEAGDAGSLTRFAS